MELIYLIAGLIGLILGAQLITKGALNIAQHFKISQFFIGITLLAIGTDLPELTVHIGAAIHRLQGTPTGDLALGDTIGSCFGQIVLTVGIIGLFGLVTITRRQLKRDALLMLGSVAFLFLAGFDGYLSAWDGAIFLLIYISYFLTLQREEKVHQKVARAPKMFWAWDALSLIGGFLILIFCAEVVVDQALALTAIWGVSQSFIGILILGLGTSLPELAISLSALRRKAYNLSIGNLIGSNLFDILFVLGLGATISGFGVSHKLFLFDVPILFMASLVVVLFFVRDCKIRKSEAIVLLLIYFTYVGLKLFGF